MGSTGQSITLANSIIGVGILAMPFCFQQCGVLLATLILLFMGLVSRLCCYFLLKSALIARRRNFEFLAFHVFGSAGKFAVEVGIIGFLMGTCIAYLVVVGDLGPQIVAKMFNINQSDILRTSIMVIVSLVCVIPLGLLRNVDSLGNVSAATIGFYFCLVIKVIAEAASQLLAGARPARVELWRPAGLLQCVPIFSMALFCQTQLFEIFESLPSLSLEKMNLVTKNAIHICTAVYFTLGLFGYIAFSAQDISGNILMSLSPTMASDVIKLGFVMSVACSFPLIIFPCRASLYSLLYKKVQSSHHDHIVSQSIPPRSFRLLTVCIVAAALCVSLLLPNIELVLGLLGSTVGVLVCVVFPAAAFVTVTFKNTNERLLAKAVIVLGLIIMVLGTYANLQAAGDQADKYDERYITKERIDKIVEDFFQKMDKSDDVMAKPDFNSKDEDSNNIDDDEIIKESVALPPNPVPPESQSHEKELSDNEAIKPIPVVKKVTEAVNNVIDKVSETHPKNLNKGNEAKIANGKNKDIINLEKPQEEIKPQSNDDMLKQKQLIETMKQHGEEQKELLKEQKEILTEMKKTQEELQKTKNGAAEAEAKKLAVESIKQIANMAIQSLAGVSDKPGQIMNEKKSEQLEKLADDAVHEIAQKAVETIEAIKEIKDKPEQVALPNVPQVPVQPNSVDPVQNIIQVHDNLKQNVVNPSQAAASNNIASNGQKLSSNVNNGNQVHNDVRPQANNNEQPNLPPAGNVLPVKNVQHQPNVDQPVANVPQPAANVPQPAANVPQPAANVPQAAANVPQPAANGPQPAANGPQPVANVPQPAANVPQPAANVPQAAANVPQSVANVPQAAANVPQAAANVPQPVANVPQPAANGPQPVANVPQSANVDQPPAYIPPVEDAVQPSVNVPEPEVNNAQPVSNVNPNNKIEPAANGIPDANVRPVLNQNKNAQTNQILQNIANANQQAAQNNIKPIQSSKQHLHSPEEPQSYKQGEDTQNTMDEIINNVARNVPLPLAINGNSKTNQQKANEQLASMKEVLNNNIIQNNGVPKENNRVENLPVRQKREVVDCAEKTTLQPEDKEICKTLMGNTDLDTEIKDSLSSNVDLSSMGLPKDLPMYQNAILHISRSLKMVEEVNKNER